MKAFFLWKKYLHKNNLFTQKKKVQRNCDPEKETMKEKCKPSGKFMERVLTYDYSFRKQFSRLYNRDFLWYKTYIDMLHVINHCLCDTKLILLSCQRRQPTIFDMNISCTMYFS